MAWTPFPHSLKHVQGTEMRLTYCLHVLGSIPSYINLVCTVVHRCNPSTLEVKAGGSGGQEGRRSHIYLCRKFEASG